MRALGRLVSALSLVAACLAVAPAHAQAPIGAESYALKLYHVNYLFYPVVEAYVRTWDTNREPLTNLNSENIRLQVKGRNYVHETAIPGHQYTIETIERRRDGFRTVIVLDASASMRGQPFVDALAAISRFVEAKRPFDQVAVLAIRDESTGYEIVSQFTDNPAELYRRIGEVQPDGQSTRLYDSVAAALQMCHTAIRGSLAAMNHAVLSTIIVISDGKDEGSAISRSELINRIAHLEYPIPVHSLAFSNTGVEHLQNIEALSTATFGRYWGLEESAQLTSTMEHIHRINRSDYVVSFRAYVPIDGEEHRFRVGVEYPTGSGNYMFGTGLFEAIESPAVFDREATAYYEQLRARYPDDIAAALGSQTAAAVPAATPQRQAEAAPAVVAPSTADSSEEPARLAATPEETDDAAAAPADSDEDDDTDALALLQDNALLILAAAILLGVIILAVAWVARGSRSEAAPSASTTTTPPRKPGAGAAPRGSDATTRLNDWGN